MDIDFSFYLVLAVAITGLIWLFDALVLAPRRKAQGKTKQPLVVEYSASFFPVLAIVLVLRSFLVEPFTIPSGSMLPTLKIGDYILVNKFIYGFRLPVVGTNVYPMNSPRRGDVLVFRYPVDPSKNYIKRVVGVPGDHIVIEPTRRNADNELVFGGITINGEKVRQDFLGKHLVRPGMYEYQFEEYLGDIRHLINRHTPQASQQFSHQGYRIDVPAGHYFVMGDNRDNSSDSRVWGFVPDSHIVGQAFAIWMFKEPGLHLPSFDRVGLIE